MNCEQAREAMLSTGTGEPDAAPALTAHVAACADCRREQAALARLSTSLRRLRAQPVPDGLDARLRLAMATARPASRRREFASWALAASILVGVAVEVSTRLAQPAVIADVTVAMREVTTVQLAFNAGHRLERVRFSLDLPPGYELDGRPGEAVVKWTGTLDAGPNLLGVPLRALGRHDGVLVARIESEGATKTFRVRLKAGEPVAAQGI